MKNQEQLSHGNMFPGGGVFPDSAPGTSHGNGASLCNGKADRQICSRVPVLSAKLKKQSSKENQNRKRAFRAHKSFPGFGNTTGGLHA
jgi:hypothetical protein